ncbi:IS110 family transposase [Brunnivagina elsteri]|uniref:IS110 family transposase n=1 Tax=Brunnivagina elsteri CCALA 953 TaxID=987040 RepID=A0A2A2THI9_9CYAN|nr:transposase [Calothrix elsteri]PAX52869.1 IS110 family transposase [Calothrix elsteri CCALA 953]
MKNAPKILGLDVSKSSVSACLLTEKPNEPRQFYYSCQFYDFSANRKDLDRMLALKPDIAVLEPTGTNYSKIWSEHLTRNGVEVKLVGHRELRSYRAHHLGLPDKDDNADALALACYWFDYNADPKRFVKNYDAQASQIRNLVLRLEHLNRLQSPVINRLRQDLAWQFPEVALVQSKRGKNGSLPLLWAWMCNQRLSKRYDTLYLKSIGLGLEASTRERAGIICNLQNQEYCIEEELRSHLRDECFTPYFQVFQEFGFGFRLSATLIAYIYPIEHFLIDGKEDVQFHLGRKSKKPTKRYLSLRRFQKTLGLAPSMESSGDKKGIKTSNGSKLCRKALWQWVFTGLEPKRRLSNETVKTLCEYLDAEKASGKPIRLVRSRVAVKAVKLLFGKLVDATKHLE